MKKILWIVGGIVALLAIGLFISSFFLGSMVKTGINTFGPRFTQTKVELTSAQLSPFSGSGTLTGLAVGNPKGWSDGNAFYLGKIHVAVVPSSVFSDHIVVTELIIDKPEFNYETKIISSNIKDLLNNIEKSTSSADTSSQPVAKNGQPLKFEVRRFVLQNGQVTLGIGPTAFKVPMPPIILTDLGTKEGGITSSQLTFAVMRSVLADVVTAAVQAAGKISGTAGAAATDSAAEAAKKASEAINKLFGGKK
ncbi:MAG TPA: hypothetical protein VKC60_18275 [Opitutaceae bacterium]|nr:hypothetical protein [Opitutaceae bacterium]